MSQSLKTAGPQVQQPQRPSRNSTQRLQKCTSLSESLGKAAKGFQESVQNAYSCYWKKVIHYIDPHGTSIPAPSSVLLSAACFFAFCVFGGFAIAFPTHGMRVAITIFGVVTFTGLIFLNVRDVIRKGDRIYNKNLGNSVILFMLTIPTMTILYDKIWYPNLNLWIEQIRQESMTKFQFPAVILMEQTDARYQANLLNDQPWTCFIGQWNETAPMCGALTEEQVLDSNPSCNCANSWIQKVQPHFSGNDTKRVLSLIPEPNLLTNSTQTFMNLQIIFNYNSSAEASPILGSPNLWLFVYDPITSAEDAYFKGYALITLINANGVTTVTLNLNYYKSRKDVPHYEYDVSVSTSPNLNLVCDVANGTDSQSYTPCTSFILLRMPSFQRTVITEVTAMSWPDAVGSAGAYFALVQLVSWILSGLAWASDGI